MKDLLRSMRQIAKYLDMKTFFVLGVRKKKMLELKKEKTKRKNRLNL